MKMFFYLLFWWVSSVRACSHTPSLPPTTTSRTVTPPPPVTENKKMVELFAPFGQPEHRNKSVPWGFSGDGKGSPGYSDDRGNHSHTRDSAEDNPDWPPDWPDMGPPNTGDAPPKHAFVSKDYGKPDFCFEWPILGDCNETLLRYAYNPFTRKCVPFNYTGCGGNENMFTMKSSCVAACELSPASLCNTDDGIPIDTMIGLTDPF